MDFPPPMICDLYCFEIALVLADEVSIVLQCVATQVLPWN